MSEPLIAIDVTEAKALLESLEEKAPSAPETTQLRNLTSLAGVDRVFLEETQHERMIELSNG